MEQLVPGSLLIDDNDPQAFLSEAPEPVSYLLFGCGLGVFALVHRRKA